MRATFRAPWAAPAALILALGAAQAPGGGHEAGFGTIEEQDVEAHLVQLCTAPLEGRDSPSAGLRRAAEYVAGELRSLGLRPVSELRKRASSSPRGEAAAQEPATDGVGAYLDPFAHEGQEPVPSDCALRVEAGGETDELEYGVDFVPAPHAGGRASGEPIFVGYGIAVDGERYDDLKGNDLEGKVAVIIEGEPRHRRLFEGPPVSPAADLHSKLAKLYAKKVAGVLVVRRPPPDEDDGHEPARDEPEPARLGFRHTYAEFVELRARGGQRPTGVPIPVLEVTPAAAERVLGFDVLPLADKIDRAGRPEAREAEGRTVTLASAARDTTTSVDNVVAWLPGTDAVLADEFVVVGAHYDHVGVDARGRIGFGADDNASGTAAMLEIAGAFAAAGSRRSVLFCAFGAEEDGLVGSRALAKNLPVARAQVVAMINLDMVGRGDANEVYAIGCQYNKDFEDLLERAKRLERARIRKIHTNDPDQLWQRSDHYSFHEIGVPVLFFFEGRINENPDYHTWRDTIDLLDLDKIARTARLAYNTAWLLANDDDRPPPPSG